MAYKDPQKAKAYQKAWHIANKEKIREYRLVNKERIKLQRQGYYKTHSEKIKAQSEAHYKANPECHKARSKTWAKANPEKVKELKKAYRKRNVEKQRAYAKAYYKANCEREKAQNTAYRKAHPEIGRELSRKHKALKRTTQVEPINDKIVYLRDGWICQICHKRVKKTLKYPNPMSASLDHIVPLSKGGSHTYANVQLTHLICNLSKNDGISEYGEQLRLC